MATTPKDFPTSLNGGEPLAPDDIRVGETHPEGHVRQEGEHGQPTARRPDAAQVPEEAEPEVAPAATPARPVKRG